MHRTIDPVINVKRGQTEVSTLYSCHLIDIQLNVGHHCGMRDKSLMFVSTVFKNLIVL